MSPRANEPEGLPPANPRPSAPRVPPAFFLMTPQGRQPLSTQLQKLLPLFWTGMLISCELIGHQGDSEGFPSCLRNTNFSQKQNSEEKHSLGCSGSGKRQLMSSRPRLHRLLSWAGGPPALSSWPLSRTPLPREACGDRHFGHTSAGSWGNKA